MKQEFEMLQTEMDEIIAINKKGGDPVMYLSGGTPLGSSLAEKIDKYWETLGNKYGFKPMSVEGSSRGKLFFLAEPTPPPPPPKTQTEIEIEKYLKGTEGYVSGQVKESLRKIVSQLESCGYDSESGFLINNIAFIALKQLATH